ncbi:nucleoside triphosphate pyrophosphohydrolase family protein [Gammaproteobacteria bacterium]|nr:nucleoside triphosphate pyrophosphohydrolase family protein [Gammaproteobacteria bacterium]MDC3368030.1 nucleoside triphosphate pyrophosphohydrolase family protein [bacterium]
MISQDDIDTFEFYNKEDLTLTEYQNAAATTAIYPASVQILYPTLGLAGEAGEVANKVKKIVRDGKLDKEGIASELGDCLWYIAAVCRDLGLNMGDIATDNLAKLAKRKENNTLKGNGDNR